jgi:hypothetical protein
MIDKGKIVQRMIEEGRSWRLEADEDHTVLFVNEEGHAIAFTEMSDDDLRELRAIIDEYLGARSTDPAPPPELAPKKLKVN